jgi:hypothetical protein
MAISQSKLSKQLELKAKSEEPKAGFNGSGK